MANALDSAIVGVHQVVAPHRPLEVLVDRDLRLHPVVVDQSPASALGIVCQTPLTGRGVSICIVEHDALCQIWEVLPDVTGRVKLVRVDAEQNLMLVRGAVPGGKNALVSIRMA